MKLTDKTIFLTGGTRGIGRALVDELAADNRLIVLAGQQAGLDRLRAAWPNIQTIQCDLADRGSIERAANEVVKKYARIDLLIHNAALQNTPGFLDETFRFDSIQREIDVNFTSVCMLTYRLLPALITNQNPALILNVNSALGLVPKTSSAIYCGTKGALNIFSRSLGYQLEQTNVKVLQAFLPLVDTEMTSGRGTGKITAEVAAKEILRGIEKESRENHIGKAKLLALINRLAPALAASIMKRN